MIGPHPANLIATLIILIYNNLVAMHRKKAPEYVALQPAKAILNQIEVSVRRCEITSTILTDFILATTTQSELHAT